MTRALVALTAITAVLAATAAGGGSQFPQRIELPNGFQPEGIAIARGQFYVGSIPTGAVYRGSVRTGQGAVLVQPQDGRAAIGLKVDRGRLFVAGGPTGMGFVYDARTGANVTSYPLSTGGSFINDVVVTRRAAWFTDSAKPVLYRVPLGPTGRLGAASAVRTVTLRGDYVHGDGFNVNGIDATPNGKTLLIVQSNTGKLFTVTPGGVANEIAFARGESVPSGDGILLAGRTLYVVQNQLNRVAKIALARRLGSGRVLSRITNPGLDVPTTIAAQGRRLYAVNARFGTDATPDTEYWITRLRR